MKKSLRILSLSIAASIAISTASTCLVSGASGVPAGPGGMQGVSDGQKSMINGIYARMLDADVISQSTYDAIEAYLTTKSVSYGLGAASASASEKPEMSDTLEKLVADGTISQSTYDAIQSYIQTNLQMPEIPAGGQAPTGMPERGGMQSQTTRPERTDGQEQAAPVRMPAAQDMTNMPEMPDRQSRMGIQGDVYSELLSKGIITQAEYDAITEAMNGVSNKTDEELNELLEKGIINQSVYEAMKAYINDDNRLPAEGTWNEGAAGMVAELLKKGVITQAQYDALMSITSVTK